LDNMILLLDTLARMGIATKSSWKNEETYSLLFVDRAKELLKDEGCISCQGAYHWAIMKLYPDLDSDVVCLLADMWAHGGVAADSWLRCLPAQA